MARITVEDCLEKIENQYDLVLLAKERTLQLNSGAEILVNEDNDKKSLRESWFTSDRKSKNIFTFRMALSTRTRSLSK